MTIRKRLRGHFGGDEGLALLLTTSVVSAAVASMIASAAVLTTTRQRISEEQTDQQALATVKIDAALETQIVRMSLDASIGSPANGCRPFSITIDSQPVDVTCSVNGSPKRYRSVTLTASQEGGPALTSTVSMPARAPVKASEIQIESWRYHDSG